MIHDDGTGTFERGRVYQTSVDGSRSFESGVCFASAPQENEWAFGVDSFIPTPPAGAGTSVWGTALNANYAPSPQSRLNIGPYTVRAGVSEDNEHQADYVVSAVKAAGGVARMYFMPHPVRNGADPIREMGGSSREAKARKLAKAEELLLASAKASDRRWSKKAHAANVLVNVAGGAIIWGLGAPSDALSSTLVGVAVGTANILSAPGAGSKDLEDYKARFGMGTAKRWDWKVVPTMGGAALQVTF